MKISVIIKSGLAEISHRNAEQKREKMASDNKTQDKTSLIEELKVSIEELLCSDRLSEEEKLSVIEEARQIIKEGSSK